MTDYFDGTVSESLLAEIRVHMAECSHCEVTVNTTQQTIHIYRNQEIYAYELPETLRDKMRASIMEKCRCSKPSRS